MITREELRELTQFRFQEATKCAISFYFQPNHPRNKAHSEEVIHTKDILRDAMREVLANGNDACVKDDLQKIAALAEELPSNHARAKAVFSYAPAKFWREFDLPPNLSESQVFVGQRFRLKPLAALIGAQPKLGVVLIDRQRARLFDLRLDKLTEQSSVFRRTPHRGDGYAGYDGGHAQRQVADEALHHFRFVADRLKDQSERGVWDKLIVGCHGVNWPEFEAQLHSYVKQRVLGHFTADVASTTDEEVRDQALRIFHEAMDLRRHDLVRQAVSLAKGHRRGVTGLRRVLRSLELGEVQTLLIGQNYAGHAVECLKCGRLDSHIVRYCSVCGNATREMEDVSEGIIPMAVRLDVELLYVNDPDLDQAGNIAAILRFRAEGRVRLSA
jgi:Peptide chain release factor 1 (eRF1)